MIARATPCSFLHNYCSWPVPERNGQNQIIAHDTAQDIPARNCAVTNGRNKWPTARDIQARNEQKALTCLWDIVPVLFPHPAREYSEDWDAHKAGG